MQHYLRITAVGIALLCMMGLAAPPAEAARLNLHRGSHGAKVRVVEARLAELKMLPQSAVDGRYRVATANAVRRFQKAMRLRVTGKVNRPTWNLIAYEVVRRRKPPVRPTLPPPPIILGHRGAVVASVTENTMGSMRYAAASADILEFDLRLTSDKQFVLLHDPTLDRTTNCSGEVAQWTLADLQAQCQADGNGDGVGDEPVPTFEEVATFAASVPIAIAPQISPGGVTSDELAQFMAIVNAHGLGTRTFVQSFIPSYFAPLRRLSTQTTFVYLGTRSLTPTAIRNAGAAIAGISLTGLTAADVAAYQKAGLRVWAYTATTSAQLQNLWGMRVNGVFTDIPATARAVYHPQV